MVGCEWPGERQSVCVCCEIHGPSSTLQAQSIYTVDNLRHTAEGRPAGSTDMGYQLMVALLLSAGAVLTETSEYRSVIERVVYQYPGRVLGDWELPECGEYSVCSVMRLRFWRAPTIHRLCRCVQGRECPWQWGQTHDHFSMALDNRSQLKFCQRVTELPRCSPKQTGIVVSSRQNGDDEQLVTEAHCHCRWPAYWQLHKHFYRNYFNGSIVSDNYFRCAELMKCKRHDFCGHVVTDTFSTYYQCSCPVGSLCLNRDRTQRNVTELLYYGPTYRAYCLPTSPSTV
ncbi:kappa-scoloptoxin(11)-Ss1a-like [Homalodisca vitripennis]|uniref:kappa-scoloptoxin(11)-Ss1a-like n=1 Tax=Homalodisca vitripennis TaxID=197043 RepID=UPI001EEAFC6F|nr:kappa-scoloptoxin(11)-Ss1a-like [Homalodisca vitripennis]